MPATGTTMTSALVACIEKRSSTSAVHVMPVKVLLGIDCAVVRLISQKISFHDGGSSMSFMRLVPALKLTAEPVDESLNVPRVIVSGEPEVNTQLVADS